MKKIECTFYRPEHVNVNEFETIVRKLEKDFHTICCGEVAENDIHEYAEALIGQARPLKHNAERCFLGLDEPDNMPGDARVDYFYRPTYLATAIIMKAAMVFPDLLEEQGGAFAKLLRGCTGRGFGGHGFDGLRGLIDTMLVFTEAGAPYFLQEHPDICEKFTRLYTDSLAMLKKRLAEGKVCNEWGEDYTRDAEKLIAENKFVAEQKDKGGADSMSNYVWYACYGTNINMERFMRYIDDCPDSAPPVDNRPFRFSHPIYFASNSSTWENKGSAFLDDSVEGFAYGRAYKITLEQFRYVKQKEGRKYRKELSLGSIDGLPVYSFTSEHRQEENSPCKNMFDTILSGLREVYPEIEECVLGSYLADSLLTTSEYQVLDVIRSAEHGVSAEFIVSETGMTNDTKSGM